MNIYQFRITDEPKRYNYFRYGTVRNIIYKNGDVIEGDQNAVRRSGKPNIYEDIQNLEKLIIETHYQKKSSEPFPNFLQIRFALDCADEVALDFLNANNISYIKVPLDITNSTDRDYSLVFFKEIPNLLNLEASNLYINDEGYAITKGKEYFSPVASKLILKGNALEVKGIFRLKELSFLICDEDTKELLEKSGLTGFSFELLSVTGN